MILIILHNLLKIKKVISDIIYHSSSIAQQVERLAVNQKVIGSNPIRGAIKLVYY